MDNWLRKARELFPDLHSRMEEADTPYLLWFELHDAFTQAYASVPRNELLIARVYEYADWCIAQPQGKTADDDLGTCVAVCFYEHIPEHAAPRDDMPRWFTVEQFLEMEGIFRYCLSEEEFNDLKDYFERNAHMYVKPPWVSDR